MLRTTQLIILAQHSLKSNQRNHVINTRKKLKKICSTQQSNTED
jgi:hypothetical protein